VRGHPLTTKQAVHERLSNPVALAIFSSDPLSSVAYATEEILLVLVLAGTAALHYSIGISIVIVGLVAILTASYRQVIFAYPSGGGAYVVAKSTLGEPPGLVAAAAPVWSSSLAWGGRSSAARRNTRSRPFRSWKGLPCFCCFGRSRQAVPP